MARTGNPSKHKMQACALAAVSGGAVNGVYNASGGLIKDTIKSVSMKLTSATMMNVKSTVAELLNGQGAAEESVRKHLKNYDCPASTALFELLLKKENVTARIVGHSQGNIAICNAINGILACRGPEAVSKMKIIAIASPTVFWEKKDIVTIVNLKNDFVGWLSGSSGTRPAGVMGWSAKAPSKSQVVTGYDTAAWNLLTHSFYLYLAELWDSLTSEFP